MNSSRWCCWWLLSVAWLALSPGARAKELDLRTVIVEVSPAATRFERKAAQMLVVEVAKRTGIRWPITNGVANGTTITLNQPNLGAIRHPPDIDPANPEFYEISIHPSENADPVVRRDVVQILGNNPRGILFGVGRLLRELEMSRGVVRLRDNFREASSPKYPLRGHQLGYRPKTNSYDAWDVDQWEQYLRDLVVFGCNAIELIPPRSDDAATSPHFPKPPMEMMVAMSHLADEYGLDVWAWYPALDPDYSDPKTVESALAEWGAVFSKLPRLDAVLVPGGDPGHTPPKALMALLEKQTENLHRFHPKAQMWVSPQGFTKEWMDEFLAILRDQQPGWLQGITFAPQVRMPIAQLRAAVPSRYPIRHYPDITHTRQCQYPVPDWDTAFAVTEGRECINPRPLDEAAIFHAIQPSTIGFITYSEGCNDDVNKFVWSALGWDPEANVTNVLREFSRYFIGPRFAGSFAQGLLALEQNWRGPLERNAGVEQTLAQFQKMERDASPAELKNWRFQQALFRAYYDAYTRRRLAIETRLEDEAVRMLQNAPRLSVEAAMEKAEAILARSETNRVEPAWRERIFKLADELYQSIRMQLSVPRYKAIAVDRGASLDTLDFPLNNREWLKARFAEIRKLPEEKERLRQLHLIATWNNPGPMGFYDDLGHVGRQPHLVSPRSFAEDPGRYESPRIGFEEDPLENELTHAQSGPRRLSWLDHAESLYDSPVTLRYTGLDRTARYRVRVVYAGDTERRTIRLLANDSVEVHPLMRREIPFRPVEFDLPPSVTASGTLSLSWWGEPGIGGNGRGCQISEVWLRRR